MSVAIDGEFQIYKWEYDTSDNSVNIMKSETTGVCIKPVVYNEYILGFRQDGTDHDMAMIEESKIEECSIKTSQELLEVEQRLLVDAYSQTPEGRVEHAEEIKQMKLEQKRREDNRMQYIKQLSKTLKADFLATLSVKDIETINHYIDFGNFFLHRWYFLVSFIVAAFALGTFPFFPEPAQLLCLIIFVFFTVVVVSVFYITLSEINHKYEKIRQGFEKFILEKNILGDDAVEVLDTSFPVRDTL